MKNKKEIKPFEEDYFEGWFKGAVGKFTLHDLQLARNWFWVWLKKLNKYVPIEKGNGRSVLEIGCSIGGVASLLSDRGFDVYASDISRYAVERAKKLSSNVKFFIFDVQKKIPLQKKFDLIIAFEVVEHLTEPEKGIKNMYNSLKPGGKLVISTPYPYSWIYRDPTHISVKHPYDWTRIMKKIGLKNVAYHKFSLIPFFYRYNKQFQVAIPFAIPISFINSPIFFIGKK